MGIRCKVEIFSAGCLVCDEAVKLVRQKKMELITKMAYFND